MRARPLLPYIKLCTWIKVRIVRFYFININILLNLLINKSHKNKGFLFCGIHNVRPYEGIYFHIIFTLFDGTVKGLSRY